MAEDGRHHSTVEDLAVMVDAQARTVEREGKLLRRLAARLKERAAAETSDSQEAHANEQDRNT